jgi:hypothetical protein
MAWDGESLSVYKLIQEWSFTVTETGITGTRVFLENLGQLPGAETQQLPTIGTEWGPNYPEVTAKVINSTYMDDKECNGRKFVVQYNGAPAIISALVGNDDLPVSVDVGGELIAVEPWATDDTGNITEYLWSWDSDGGLVKQPVFFHQGIANIRFTKVVASAEDFVKLSMTYVGHVNEGTFFSFPTGWVLYEGASLYQFKNKMGFNRWKAELHFSVRNVTDDAGEFNGWNFVLRKDADVAEAKWDRPVDPKGNYLYSALDFDNLLGSMPLSDNEDYFNDFPAS